VYLARDPLHVVHVCDFALLEDLDRNLHSQNT
jgi:hypothetical protein